MQFMSLNTQRHETFEEARSRGGACGVVLVANIEGQFSRGISEKVIAAVQRMEHRGGMLSERNDDGTWTRTGDGAGVSMNFDHDFAAQFVGRDVHAEEGETPFAATLFVPRRHASGIPGCQRDFEEALKLEGFVPLGIRVVPTDPSVLGRSAQKTAPHVVQLFFGSRERRSNRESERALFEVEQRMRRKWQEGHETSFNLDEVPGIVELGRNVTYKVLGTSAQLPGFYPEDTKNPPASSIAIGHRRQTTNSASLWKNVQPCSKATENGENNAIMANRNEVRRLEGNFERIGKPISILSEGASDSRDFSDFLAYLMRVEGLALEEAMRVTVLPAWWEMRHLAPEVKQWLMQRRRQLGVLSSWGEGPKFSVASDGRTAAAIVDRMGYRPARWSKTQDGLFVIESEVGATPIDRSSVIESGNLPAGGMVILDTFRRELFLPERVYERLLQGTERIDGRSSQHFVSWHRVELDSIDLSTILSPNVLGRFGWKHEDMEYVDTWLKGRTEPRGAMGRDWAPAAVSRQHPTLTEYAFPIVASCTNPANDPELEGGAFDTTILLGNPEAQQYGFEVGILTPEQVKWIQNNPAEGLAKAMTLSCAMDFEERHIGESPEDGANRMKEYIDEIVGAALRAVQEKRASIIILSHEAAEGGNKIPIETFKVASALNEALISHGLSADIVVDTPAIRNRHEMLVHFQCGVKALCPRALFARARVLGVTDQDVIAKGREAIAKAMSLAGNTTFSGWVGAKLLEFVGFGHDVMRYLPGFTSNYGGIDMKDVYEDVVWRFLEAKKATTLPRWQESRKYSRPLTRDNGPIQNLARTGDFKHYEAMEAMVKNEGPVQLWDLLELKPFGPPISIKEVISEEEIVRILFRIAHMSFGALGDPAHRAMARFANKHGITSGSGEGGESPERSTGGRLEGDMSRDREVASARYGVTISYLADANVATITLKIHQGGKPDESADMPEEKNSEPIAAARRVEPGTRLRSAVTNLDLFSIEEFPMMVTLLREANPNAKIVIKIASNTGTDTIALGVLKSMPDEINITGGEGGTGSATLEAIRHTGHPREIGLADAHRGLISNGLEDEVELPIDGGMLLADDCLKALGFGGRYELFGTAGMSALGCLLLRRCNIKDGCKPGVATQDQGLQQNFVALGNASRPNASIPLEERIDIGVERLENFFIKGLAHGIRKRCAKLGIRSPLELWQRTDHLAQKVTGIQRLDKLDLSRLIQRDAQPGDFSKRIRRRVERVKTTAINERMVAEVKSQIDEGRSEIRIECEANNFDQAIGTRLAGEMVRNPHFYGGKSVNIRIKGTPGFGCFALLHSGMTGILEGEGGEDFAAGITDGVVVVARPSSAQHPEAHVRTRVGNNAFYGATGGEGYVRDGLGLRGCAALSGTTVCVEGDVGKYFTHGMRKGLVVQFGGMIGDAPFCGFTGGKVFTLSDKQDLEKATTHHSVVFRSGLNGDEGKTVQEILRKHINHTGSTKAQEILDNWDEYKDRWTVVEANREEASSSAGVKHKIENQLQDFGFPQGELIAVAG